MKLTKLLEVDSKYTRDVSKIASELLSLLNDPKFKRYLDTLNQLGYKLDGDVTQQVHEVLDKYNEFIDALNVLEK